jgi:P-type Ca2+ transporter type 2C
MDFYTRTKEESLQLLESSAIQGLSTVQVGNRIKEYGKNELPEPKKENAFVKFLKQFTDVLVLVLIAAAIISFVLGELLDGIVVLAIVILNGIMGYIQEAKAEKALEALKKMSSDFSKVLRDGIASKIPSAELVPGDIVILESGDKVPADCRLIEAVNLDISEAILTGESLPVKKTVQPITQDNPALAEKKNMVFRDTTVVNGRGLAAVTATGLSTEIGKISSMLESQKVSDAPLTKQLATVGKKLSLFAGVVIIVIFMVGIVTGGLTLRDAFFTSVSLAVAAIPEGLPAIVTIVLAIGVSRLSKVNAIMRKLSAVETLGSTSFILTDKTGTLTQNKMTVTDIALVEEHWSLGADGKLINSEGTGTDVKSVSTVTTLLNSAVLCSDVQVTAAGYIGDPTEVALVESAVSAGIDVKQLKTTYKRIFEIPFNSVTKKMLVVVKDPIHADKMHILAKGAPEVIAKMLNIEDKVITAINNTYTNKGLRSLAFSTKEITLKDLEQIISSDKPFELEHNHEFLGILAQRDPLRPEVKSALERARSAGIETVMLTGDNLQTAMSIAKEINLITSEDQAVNGPDINNATQDDLIRLLEKLRVFARVTPEQKLQLVQALQSQHKIVAVTGDGVNDAPAIKTADIGIAMGESGTDVAKGASDMVLQDDNYATIVEAVKQGRIVYDNLVKFIRYLVSCNLSEILVVGISVFSGLPLPLLPIQILWINLVTDGFPALSLGIEPGERDIMQRKPRNPTEDILTPYRWGQIFFESTLITISALTAYVLALSSHSDDYARTAVLTTLALAQIFHTYNNRSEIHSVFSRSLNPNPKLTYVVIFTVLLQLLVVYTEVGNALFRTVPIDLEFLIKCIILALLPVLGAEISKAVRTRNLMG